MSRTDHDLIYVLVIDDDPDMRTLLTDILLPGGHQVMAVESAEAGLELLPFNTFQVAFLDQNLPGMEGFVLGEYLRKHNPAMEIALVTGSEDSRLEKLVEEHQIHLIAKPFEPSAILDVVTAYREGESQRTETLEVRESEDFSAPVFRFFDELDAYFAIPSVPNRVEERLVRAIKDALRDLRSERHYSERARVLALSGLITLQVLGIKIPKNSAGQYLTEEYDELMKLHGRAKGFRAETMDL